MKGLSWLGKTLVISLKIIFFRLIGWKSLVEEESLHLGMRIMLA